MWVTVIDQGENDRWLSRLLVNAAAATKAEIRPIFATMSDGAGGSIEKKDIATGEAILSHTVISIYVEGVWYKLASIPAGDDHDTTLKKACGKLYSAIGSQGIPTSLLEHHTTKVTTFE